MNSLVLKSDNKKVNLLFKVLMFILAIITFWASIEIGRYIIYLFKEKFLLWGLGDSISNIMYLFNNIIGVFGVILMLVSLYKVINKENCKVPLIISFILQLISCSSLVVDSILQISLPNYLETTLNIQKYYFLFGNILLVISLVILIFYMANICKKKVALISSSTMIIVDILVLLDLFLISFESAKSYFFTLSLSIKLLFILVSIATLLVVKYTEFKKKI